MSWRWDPDLDAYEPVGRASRNQSYQGTFPFYISAFDERVADKLVQTITVNVNDHLHLQDQYQLWHRRNIGFTFSVNTEYQTVLPLPPPRLDRSYLYLLWVVRWLVRLDFQKYTQTAAALTSTILKHYVAPKLKSILYKESKITRDMLAAEIETRLGSGEGNTAKGRHESLE